VCHRDADTNGNLDANCYSVSHAYSYIDGYGATKPYADGYSYGYCNCGCDCDCDSYRYGRYYTERYSYCYNNSYGHG